MTPACRRRGCCMCCSRRTNSAPASSCSGSRARPSPRKILRDDAVRARRGRCWRASSARCWPASTALALVATAGTSPHDGGEGNCRARAGLPQFRLAAAGVRTGAALAARPRSRSVGRGDAGAWRFPPRQSHHRSRRRCARCWTGNSRISAIPMEDLGWICVNSWRFGEIDKPVGGFGTREELFAGYEAAGRRVDPDRVNFWEVMGTLRWGVMCCGMMQRFRTRPRAFDRARDDRPPLVGDRDRSVAAAGAAER